MVAQVGYSIAGRSRGRMAPCVVCTWHVETRSADFLIERQNQDRRFVSSLASKPLRRFSLVWTKTSGDDFLQFGLKTGGDGFSRFGLKTGDRFLVEHQNQGGGGFSDLGLKTGSSGLVIWASKSPRRFLGLGHKTRQASVCQLCHKIDGGRLAWDTHRDLAVCFTWKQVWIGFSSMA
jgi:hypothetical protein